MTNRARNARVLREVRTRMRDIAAASHALATAQHDTTQKVLAAEEGQLQAYLDSAHLSLAAARTIHDFDFVSYHVDGHKQAIAGAAAEHSTSTTRKDESHVALVASTRQLKTAEKLVERIAHEAAKTEQRNEQRAQDDLTRRREIGRK
jgi:flagellar biosynthesis chaperone FliJ